MNDDDTITVDMGPPILDGPEVPTTLAPNADGNSVVEQSLECNGKEWKVSAVSMGTVFEHLRCTARGVMDTSPQSIPHAL